MTLRRSAQRVCDICGEAKDVARYRIEYVVDSRRLSVDLCPRHAKPLEAIGEAVPSKGGGRSGLRPREVVSEAAVRRARKKAANSKTPSR